MYAMIDAEQEARQLRIDANVEAKNSAFRLFAKDYIAKGYIALVVVAFDYNDKKRGYKQRGDIISKHKTYDAAFRKAKDNCFVCVQLLDYLDYQG